jgi:nitrite reductase (NAD(P)H)
VYRNISDLDAIIEYATRDEVKHAVVVGGGLLGLEAAKAVYDLETSVFYAFNQLTEGPTVFRNRIEHVSIINRQAYPLSRQLDADAGEMVLLKIEAMGVHVCAGCVCDWGMCELEGELLWVDCTWKCVFFFLFPFSSQE